jgi:hypothetical protein
MSCFNPKSSSVSQGCWEDAFFRAIATFAGGWVSREECPQKNRRKTPPTARATVVGNFRRIGMALVTKYNLVQT